MCSDRSREHLPAENHGDLNANFGFGASYWNAETGEANATMRCTPEQSEADGSIPFGYLSAIADNNNAMANIRTAAWSDNSILIEVSYQAARPARGTVEVRSYNSAYNEAMAVAEGVMVDDSGVFGQSQCTSVTVPARPMVTDRGELPQIEHLSFPWESNLEPAPVDRYLKGGLRPVEGGAVYTTQLGSSWSSNFGSLHGGAVGLVITRAMRYAAIAAAPDNVDHVPISFSINYVRPTMAVPEPMEARARVLAVTNRFCSLEGELILPSGKPAARCRVIHRLVPRPA